MARAGVHAGVALALGLLFVLATRLPGLSEDAANAVANLGQIVAVGAAAVLCWLASRVPGAPGRAWRWIAVGVGAWAGGQVVWTWYEIPLDTEVPFPSLADVGFLVFPVAAGLGLLFWLGSQHTMRLAARSRDLLDAAVIALSLLVLSWVTSLRAVADAAEGDQLALSLSLAYPVTDVVLATLALLAVSRDRSDEAPVLLLLAVGLIALAVADSAYVYLVSVGLYSSADLITSVWVLGFLLVGAAAQLERTRPRSPHPVATPAETPSLLASALPYIPFGAAGVGLAVSLLQSPERRAVDVALAGVLVVLVLSRQFLALAENHRLYDALENARDQLQHQVLHDNLTGLANRALFNDRLDRALRRPGHDIALLFCDLDDFKQVNDRHGHDVGDLLLQAVAERLVGCVRTQDTVARIGGDEFAILLEDPGDAQAVAERIIQATGQPFELRDVEVQVTVSVGTAYHRAVAGATGPGRRTADQVATRPGAPTRGDTADSPGSALSAPDVLLRAADQAMYAAKTAGKGRAVLAGDDDSSATG